MRPDKEFKEYKRLHDSSIHLFDEYIEDKKKPLLTWNCGDNLADQAQAPKYLINNILETDAHGMFAGDSMAFKTFVDLRMAYSICTGIEFMGNQVYETGIVLYVCGEGKGALARRIKALKICESDFKGNLMVLEEHLMIDNPTQMVLLRQEIERINPVLVIFDTFGSLVGDTDENSASDVGRTLRLIKETCRNGVTSSMIVHHYGKDGSKGMRGSIAFKANTDFEFSLERQQSTMITVMSCVKMKDGENFNPIAMQAHIIDLGLERQDGSNTTSLVIKPCDKSFKIDKGLSFATIQVFESLVRCIEEVGSNYYMNNGVVCGVTNDDFRPYCYPILNVADNSKRNTLKRHLEKLIIADKIMINKDIIYLIDSVT